MGRLTIEQLMKENKPEYHRQRLANRDVNSPAKETIEEYLKINDSNKPIKISWIRLGVSIGALILSAIAVAIAFFSK